MLRNSNRYFVELVNDRADEITNDVAENNKAYSHFTSQIIKVLNTIKNTLPLEHRELLEELDDLQGKRDLITCKALYKCAFMDGVRLHYLLHEKKV